jgi:hypothetical protein
MVGNMAKGIYGSWISTLNESWSVGSKGNVRMMIAMVGASGMYGLLEGSLMVGFAFY